MKKLTTLILLGLTIVSCGGGSSSGAPRQILFSLGGDNDISASISDDPDYTLSYTAQIYENNDGEVGDAVGDPIEVTDYNEDENVLAAQVQSLEDGDYFVRLYLMATAEFGGQSYSLYTSNITVSVSVTEFSVMADLTASDWDYTYDDDEDGLVNYRELQAGTDPFDTDSDDDSALDGDDAFPLDATESADLDEDGIGNNADTDIDGDDVLNTDETALGTSALDSDSDDDTFLDGVDNCPVIANVSQTDTDQDGDGDECDDDRDNDGLTNTVEAALGTDVLDSDSDDDGAPDGADVFPLNFSESADNDSDDSGNNADADDDNDGVSDVVENTLGSNPFSADSDEDGVEDADDNCIIVANATQTDTDSDDSGNDCDLDDDGDTLSDEEEAARGTDGFLTESLDADSDDDGTADSADLCPNDPATTTQDADGDGLGTTCDCDDSNADINLFANDDPDLGEVDTNCDGIDGDRYAAIFVSEYGDAEVTASTLEAPTSDLNGAIALAASQGYDVYVSTGEYDISAIELADGVSLYGAFSDDFSDRDLTQESESTVLYNGTDNDSVTALSITGFENPITLAGFVFQNRMTEDSQTVVAIEDATVTLQNNRFEGNADIDTETLLSVSGGDVTVQASFFAGASAYTTTGLEAIDAEGSVTNSIFSMGSGTHAIGLSLTGSDWFVVNNSIDGGQHGTRGDSTSYGVRINGSSPTLVNNIIATQSDGTQSSIICVGDEPVSTLTVENNIFYRETSRSFTPSVYSGCDASRVSTDSGWSSTSEVSASNNTLLTDTDAALSDIVDSDYVLAAGSVAIDAGQDTSSSSLGAVELDYWGNARSDGAYDIGASEF